MSAVLPHAKRWLTARWWAVVAVVFGLQLGLILWLGERGAPRPQPLADGPGLKVAGRGSKELLALADPTLFALPHREGFSGSAWLSVPPQEIQPFAWTEPPRYLELPIEQLATAFPVAAAGNSPERSGVPAEFAPEFLLPAVDERQLFPAKSRLRVTGGLEHRANGLRVDLPSWPHTDLLTNTVVQVLVDAEGSVFSAILLGPGSGLKKADDYAVRQAGTTKFDPLPDQISRSPFDRLAWGELVFEWHTVPATDSQNRAP